MSQKKFREKRDNLGTFFYIKKKELLRTLVKKYPDEIRRKV